MSTHLPVVGNRIHFDECKWQIVLAIGCPYGKNGDVAHMAYLVLLVLSVHKEVHIMALLLQVNPPPTISASKPMYDEELVRDDRESITATQHIQMKLRQMLPNTSLPVSSMHTCRLTNRYSS